MTKQVLIYFEVNNGIVEQVSKEIYSHCRMNFFDCDINAVALVTDSNIDSVKQTLSSIGLNKLYLLCDNIYDSFNVCLYSDALADLIIESKPDILLIGATDDGRELAPRTASKLDIGLTADCTDLQVDGDFKLLATRPTYGGKLMAVISSKTLPNFATVRPGAFKLNSAVFNSNIETEFIIKEPKISGISCLYQIINCEDKPETEDWTCSEIIVAGGLGLQNKENFDLIYKFADKIGGKPAASRAAVEQGWADSAIQVGQTGKSVSPKLYIAFGISGAMQHITGITNSDKIIAVNIDENAPIMKSADVSIAADAVSVLNKLVQN